MSGLRSIENEHLRVTVSDHGAELASVYDKGLGLERIWCADPSVWNRHAPILFPFVGKVNGGEYRYGGKKYAMKSQHGFARDSEFECVSVGLDSIVHLLTSDAKTREVYPFDFELTVTHRFDPQNPRVLKVQWEVRNCSDGEMLYSIGAHPGFAVPALPDESRSMYYLSFPGKEKLSYILVSPKTALAVPEVSYDLPLEGGLLPIADDLFDRDALIFEKGQVDVVGIARPDKSPYVTMRCAGFPFLGVWSKPTGRFVCLEPWLGRTDDDGFAGELQDKAGEQALKAGEAKTYSYSMEFHA